MEIWIWAVEYTDGATVFEQHGVSFGQVDVHRVAALLLFRQHTLDAPLRIPIPLAQRAVFIRRRSVSSNPALNGTRTIAGWGEDGHGQFVVLPDQGQPFYTESLGDV